MGDNIHPMLLRMPVELYDWIAAEAQNRKWSKPQMAIEMLERSKKRIESERKGTKC